MPRPSRGGRQGVFCKAVARQHRAGTKAEGRKATDEPFDHLPSHRLGAVERTAPAREIEARELLVGDLPRAQRVREVRGGRDGPSHASDQGEPRRGVAHKLQRRHDVTREARHQRLKQVADQTHVVIQRQPRHRDVAFAEPVTRAPRAEAGDDVLVGQENSLGASPAPRGELAVGEGIWLVPHRSLAPVDVVQLARTQHGYLTRAEQRRELFRQRFWCRAEQSSRLAALDDLRHPLLASPTGLERVGPRDGDRQQPSALHPEESRHEPTGRVGKEHHGAPRRETVVSKHCREGRSFPVETPVCHLVRLVAGPVESQTDPLRLPLRPLTDDVDNPA